MIGAGLILYVTTFGFHKTQRFFNEKTYEVVKVGALSLYSVTMIYYFYTSANAIKSMIPLGTPGDILSGGMILPINLFCGTGGGVHHVCVFCPVPERRNVRWDRISW